MALKGDKEFGINGKQNPVYLTHPRPWRAPARSRVGSTKVAPGSPTGSPADRTPHTEGAKMETAQCTVRPT